MSQCGTKNNLFVHNLFTPTKGERSLSQRYTTGWPENEDIDCTVVGDTYEVYGIESLHGGRRLGTWQEIQLQFNHSALYPNSFEVENIQIEHSAEYCRTPVCCELPNCEWQQAAQ